MSLLNEVPPDEDPIEEGPPRVVASLARWWPRIAVIAFASMVGGWAWREVPADWHAGRPWRASVEALLVGVVFYAWLRFLLQIWRGQRAAAEEQALARLRERARLEELAARARQRD
jgi:hypothetical protein